MQQTFNVPCNWLPSLLQTAKQFAAILTARGKLPAGGDLGVYPIIAPRTGGAEHPKNYVVLRSHFPREYRNSDEAAQMHNIMMAGLLGQTRINAAVKISIKHGAYSVPPQPNGTGLMQRWREMKGAAFSWKEEAAPQPAAPAAAGEGAAGGASGEAAAGGAGASSGAAAAAAGMNMD
jgi:hypothetical protein